jgi:hypothetical protein
VTHGKIINIIITLDFQTLYLKRWRDYWWSEWRLESAFLGCGEPVK